MARMKRLYAPYVKVGNKWQRAKYEQRIDTIFMREIVFKAYFKEKAIKVYQNWLLEPFIKGIDEIRELRPIPLKSMEYDEYIF